MTPKTALIFNPSAGGGKAGRKQKKVEASLVSRDISYDLFLTESEAHLIKTVKEVIQSHQLIIGAGGDTTLNIIATEILRAQNGNILGVIGLGSVNDLARELGVIKLEKAADAIKYGTPRAIDLGIVSPVNNPDKKYYFLVSASLGLGVSVNRYVDIWMRKHPFFSSFRSATQGTAAVSGIRQAFKKKEVPLELKLETQGIIHDIVSPLLVFSNTGSFGGNFRPSPYASLLSGKLDCCIFNMSSLTKAFTVTLDVKRQKHLIKETVRLLQDETFKLLSDGLLEFQMDGEIIEIEGDVNISIMPGALNVQAHPNFTGRPAKFFSRIFS